MSANNKYRFDVALKTWIDYLKGIDSSVKPEDIWLTVTDTCQLLRFSEITFYRKIKSGQILYSKPSSIMVWLSDVAKYVIDKESYKV